MVSSSYLLYALLFSIVPVVAAVGNFIYCCDIQKCNNVTAVCQTNSDCQSACAAELSCEPPEQLAVKDYSCFRNHLNNTQYTALGIICNQTYNPLQSPAPSFLIDYATCNRDCSGWALADPSKPNAWAALILQYILPVVIFSMTIPRGQKWEVKDWWFDFELNHIEGILRAIVSLFWAGTVVIVDMTVWVFFIFVLAGPMLVGGIHEAVLDYTIVQHLEDTEHIRKQVHDEFGGLIREDSDFHHLSEEDKVELLLAVLSGNLDRTVGEPQNILRGVIGLSQAAPYMPTDRRKSRYSLGKGANTSGKAPERKSATIARPSLESAGSTGAIGPASNKSDRGRLDNSGNGSSTAVGSNAQQPDTALPSPMTQGAASQKREHKSVSIQERRTRLDVAEMRLRYMLQSQYSFGSIVGAPVLFYIGAFIYTLVGLSANKGDNNTAHSLAFGMWWMGIVHVAIVSGCLLASNNPSTVTAILAEEIVRQEKKQQESFEKRRKDLTYFPMSPVYHSQFMPVLLWDRGRMKRLWIESTNAYTEQWFRERINIRIGWILIPLAAFFLILVPSVLAFMVSYTTPRICLSCRSLTFLLYTGCQLILIIATTFHTRYSTTYFNDAILSLPRASHIFSRIILALCFFIAISSAVGLSLFTAFVGTLMQIIGVYHNCLCSIPATSWTTTRDSEMFNLPTDTAEDRDASKYWAGCGYMAIGFMVLVCYVGWWYQRYLRKRFMQRVNGLPPGKPELEMSGSVHTGMSGVENEKLAAAGMRSTHAGKEGYEGESLMNGTGDGSN